MKRNIIVSAIRLYIDSLSKKFLHNIKDFPHDYYDSCFKDVNEQELIKECECYQRNRELIDIHYNLPQMKKVCNNIGFILANQNIQISEYIVNDLNSFVLCDTISEEEIRRIYRIRYVMFAMLGRKAPLIMAYLFNIMQPALKMQLESAYRDFAKVSYQDRLLGTIDEQVKAFKDDYWKAYCKYTQDDKVDL